MLAGRAPETGAGAFDPSLAAALYADLLGRLEESLAGKAHLIVVPPPDMLRLPFAALVTRPPATGASPDWLIRHHAVSVLPSIAGLRALRAASASGTAVPGRFLGVGDPVLAAAAPVDCGATLPLLRAAGGATSMLRPGEARPLPLADPARLAALPRLPDTACEVQAAAALFPTSQVLLGAAATETALKAADATGALAEASVILFATHGLVAGEAGAMAPGLVLTPPGRATDLDDGLLTAPEIAMLRLDAELVVLSACNTAAGDTATDEGLSGLARAFFTAGARSLMVTQWSVYSTSALEISTALFAARAADPALGSAAALRRAMLGILDDPQADAFRRHPAYWAAYTMIGAE